MESKERTARCLRKMQSEKWAVGCFQKKARMIELKKQTVDCLRNKKRVMQSKMWAVRCFQRRGSEDDADEEVDFEILKISVKVIYER